MKRIAGFIDTAELNSSLTRRSSWNYGRLQKVCLIGWGGHIHQAPQLHLYNPKVSLLKWEGRVHVYVRKPRKRGKREEGGEEEWGKTVEDYTFAQMQEISCTVLFHSTINPCDMN